MKVTLTLLTGLLLAQPAAADDARAELRGRTVEYLVTVKAVQRKVAAHAAIRGCPRQRRIFGRGDIVAGTIQAVQPFLRP